MVGIILLRTVHSDISRYNAIDLSEDVQEDFGWKLIHGEVFRPPKKRMLLSVAVGSGAQLTAMAVVTLSMLRSNFCSVIIQRLIHRDRSSFRFIGIIISFKSRIIIYGDDCLLDFVWHNSRICFLKIIRDRKILY
jgi:hypothetical protein